MEELHCRLGRDHRQAGWQAGRQAGQPMVPGEEQLAGQAFLSMVLKNHSVNLRSWAVAVWDSSCSLMLSCLRCWT